VGYHYIPQHYLEGFATPSCPGELWQFDKHTLSFTEQRVAIKKVAQQRSFYNATTERYLNKYVECPGNRILDKLRSGNLLLVNEERRILSKYIATMLMRVPYRRSKREEMAVIALRNICSSWNEQICMKVVAGGMSHEKAKSVHDEVEDIKDKIESEIPSSDETRNPFPTDRVISMLYDMKWHFVCANDDEYFVTTDNPAFFFECYGLGTEKSEFSFPVSQSLAIFGSRKSVAIYNSISHRSQFVKEANRRLISEASRFIYSPFKADWIHKVAAKRKLYLSRIEW
jgi:hypothetical protein